MWRVFNLASALGALLALAAICLAAAVTHFWPNVPTPPLAGQRVFEQHPFYIFLIGTVWAPTFETLIGQVLPVSISKMFTDRKGIWILSGGLTFGVGHVLGGGGAVQFAITFFYGSLFTSAYIYWSPLGLANATFGVVVLHAVNNGILISYSFYND